MREYQGPRLGHPTPPPRQGTGFPASLCPPGSLQGPKCRLPEPPPRISQDLFPWPLRLRTSCPRAQACGRTPCPCPTPLLNRHCFWDT